MCHTIHIAREKTAINTWVETAGKYILWYFLLYPTEYRKGSEN